MSYTKNGKDIQRERKARDRLEFAVRLTLEEPDPAAREEILLEGISAAYAWLSKTHPALANTPEGTPRDIREIAREVADRKERNRQGLLAQPGRALP